MAVASFQLLLPGDETPAPDPLGLWVASPAAADAYAIGGEQPGMVWRADLPPDPAEAARALGAHSLALRQAGRALQAASPLLDYDLRQAADRAAAGLSFEAPTTGEPPRQAVLAEAFSYNLEGVSFGLGDELAAARQAIAGFSGRVRRLVDQFALVESSLGGRPGARTRITWLGDVHTWWTPASPAAAVANHNQLLAQAVATRQEWLRFLMFVTSGAVKVGLALGAGPFNPIAIWTVWNYVQKVLEQYRGLSISSKEKTA